MNPKRKANSSGDAILFLIYEEERRGQRLKELELSKLNEKLSSSQPIDDVIESLVNQEYLREDKKRNLVKLTQKGEKLVQQMANDQIWEYVSKKSWFIQKKVTLKAIRKGTGLNQKLIVDACSSLLKKGILRKAGVDEYSLTNHGIAESDKKRIDYRERYKKLLNSKWYLVIASSIIGVLFFVFGFPSTSKSFFGCEKSPEVTPIVVPAPINIEQPLHEGPRDSTHNLYALFTLLDSDGNDFLSRDIVNEVNKEKRFRDLDSLGVGLYHRKFIIEDSAQFVGRRYNADIVIFGGVKEYFPDQDSIQFEVIFESLLSEPTPEIYLPIRNLTFQPVPQQKFKSIHIAEKNVKRVSGRLFLLIGILTRYQREFGLSNFYLSKIDMAAYSPDLRSQIHGLKGDNHIMSGDSSLGTEQYNLALQYNPANIDALVNQAVAYIHLGKYDLAEQNIKKAMRLEADTIQNLHNLGCIFYYEENHEMALATFKDVLSMIQKGHAFFPFLDDYNNAILAYENSLLDTLATVPELSPDPPGNDSSPPNPGRDLDENNKDPQSNSPFEVGEELKNNQMYKMAIFQFSKAIENGQGLPEAQYYRAVCYLKEKDFGRACEDFEKSKGVLNPQKTGKTEEEEKNENAYYYNYGLALKGARRYDEAASKFTIQINKDNDRSLSNDLLYLLRGKCYKEAANYKAALADCERIIGNGNGNYSVDGYQLLAETHQRLGNVEEAISAYFKYLEKKPSSRNKRIYSDALILAAEFDKRTDFFKLLDLFCSNNGSISELEGLMGMEKFINEEEYQEMKARCP